MIFKLKCNMDKNLNMLQVGSFLQKCLFQSQNLATRQAAATVSLEQSVEFKLVNYVCTLCPKAKCLSVVSKSKR